MTALVIRSDAAHLPLPDASVDLVVTSPPYFALRIYQDGGEHYAKQIGSEPTPQEFLEALWACTAEWMRVLKPGGSIFVNLGDKYAGGGMGGHSANLVGTQPQGEGNAYRRVKVDTPNKSLMLLPERYRIGCVDRLGLIARSVIIWDKPNGLPESVTDRVRRSHEDWVHLTKLPRYYSAIDEIREPTGNYRGKTWTERRAVPGSNPGGHAFGHSAGTSAAATVFAANELGKLPGSVWTVATEPLNVPDHLGVDHFACVDDQTEILTEHGWVRHEHLIAGEVIAGYDMEQGQAVWTECLDVHRYDYDGEMVAVESRDLSMRLTPNHRTLVQRMHTRTKVRGQMEMVRADELDRYHFIPRSTPWESYGGAAFPSPALMGWVAAEGWYRPEGNGQAVYLSQSLTANPDKVAAIDALVHDAYRTERKRTYKGESWVEVQWRLSPVQSEMMRRSMPDKMLPWLLVQASEWDRRQVLDAFIDGDGHRRPDGRIGIYQKLRHNLDVLQAVAVTLGYKTTLTEEASRFVLYLTEGGRSVTLRGTSGVGSKVKREHYTGTVWCPTTGTGTFIARRNGAVFITGNSFPTEWPRRIIQGWSPAGICVACGEGRRPVTEKQAMVVKPSARRLEAQASGNASRTSTSGTMVSPPTATITGYVCACPTPDAPTRPSVILDPFGGTGTTALCASVLGRIGISVDLSHDYSRLARWRTTDPGQRAKAMRVQKPPVQLDGQADLFGGAA